MEGFLEMIYLDNAATTKMDEKALEYYLKISNDFFGNPSQPYTFGKKAKKYLTEAREIIAHCINAEPDEIFFTSGGTESDNWVIKEAGDFSRKKTIVSSIEHHAILNSCKKLDDVLYIPVDNKGLANLNYLKEKVDKNTRIVSVMLVNNEIGTIQPIKKIAKIAHKNNCLCHTDAVQAIGHINVNVKELDVDLLSASGHKFNGPKGVGFLYIKKGTRISIYENGGMQESGMRSGTENVAAIYAMAIALQNNVNSLNENIKKIKALEEYLIDKINDTKIDYVVNGGKEKLPGLLSISFRNNSGELILHRLDLKNICVSTGSACDSKNTQVSHVLKSINLDRKYALGTIRVSIAKNNTKEEIDVLVNEIEKIIKREKYNGQI